MTTQMYTSRFTLTELLHAFKTLPRTDGGMQTHLCPTICEIIRVDHNMPFHYYMSLETSIFRVLHSLSPDDFRPYPNNSVSTNCSVLESELVDYERFMNTAPDMNFCDELRDVRDVRVNYLSHLIAKVGDVQLEFTAKVWE